MAFPHSHTRAAWIVAIAGGPVLFIGGRAVYEYTVSGRTSWTRPAGLAALCAAAPAMIPLNTLAAPFLVDVVLLGIVIADAATHWRRHPGTTHPPPAPN